MKTRTAAGRAREYAVTCQRRAETRDETPVLTIEGRPLPRRERINLGLALLQRRALPGACFSQTEIAYWCGCTEAAIRVIEQSALQKLRRGLWLRGDPLLRELIVGLFEERSCAAPVDHPAAA